MKTKLLILSLLVAYQLTLAQSAAQSEAKAAYLLAEEAFAASDWKGTIDYLQQCKRLMRTANSKILYLQVMTTAEQAKLDPVYYDSVQTSIAAFEKAPDINKFNEEKVLEVMKLKLTTTRKQEEALKAKAEADKVKAAMIEKENRLKALGGVVVYEANGHGLIVADRNIGRMNWMKANKACEDLVLNGHDDWYLPTRKELVQIYNALHVTNQMRIDVDNVLWTSEATVGVLAWTISFFNGKQTSWGKTTVYAVRPVRRF